VSEIGRADLALVLFATARFSMAAAGPASAGFVGLIGFEDRFDSGDPAVAEIPGLGVEPARPEAGRRRHCQRSRLQARAAEAHPEAGGGSPGSCYVCSMLQRTPHAGEVIFWWVGRKIVHHGGKLHLPRVVAPQVQANAVPRERCVSELVFDVSSGNGLIAQAAYGAVSITRKEGLGDYEGKPMVQHQMGSKLAQLWEFFEGAIRILHVRVLLVAMNSRSTRPHLTARPGEVLNLR